MVDRRTASRAKREVLARREPVLTQERLAWQDPIEHWADESDLVVADLEGRINRTLRSTCVGLSVLLQTLKTSR